MFASTWASIGSSNRFSTTWAKVEAVYILDDYARGIDSGIIDVLIVGDVDEQKVVNVAKPIEKKLARKVRTMTMTAAELETLRDTILSRPNLKVL